MSQNTTAMTRGGVQAPSAAPGPVSDTQHSQFLSDVLTAAGLITHGKRCKALGERLSDMVMRLRAASPTPPAEQQATKETSGGFHVWRDISTAPKDGSRFVAIGYNYGLYSEGRHICVAQWFRGCWMETSDWNEASELQHLTHWLPLPSPPDDVAAPAEQQAAPKAAPGEPVAWRISCPNEPDLGFWLAEEDGGEGFLSEPLYTRTAPQAAGQDARPCHVFTVRKAGGLTEWEPTTMALALPDGAHALYTLPQPSPHAQADSVTAPAVASEPIAYLYDDGSWTPAKTEEGHKLNDWMISAGSPKIGVHLASTAQPTPLTTLAQATQVGNQQEAREPVSPRHPVVMQWRDNAIEACAKIADAYGHEHAAQDMRAMLTAPQQEAQEPMAHDEDLLERLYWDFDSQRKKTGEERLAFKGKMRSYASEFRRRSVGQMVFAQSVSDDMMNLADRLGDLPYVDPRAWRHLLVYAPQQAPAPLSDAQIKELIEDGVFLGNCKEIVRAIEHAHGITGDGK